MSFSLRWDRVFLRMKLAFFFITIPGNSSYNSYTFAHSLCYYFTAALKGTIRCSLSCRNSGCHLFFYFALNSNFYCDFSGISLLIGHLLTAISIEECRSIFVAQMNFCTRPILSNPNMPSKSFRRISLALLRQTGYTRTFFILLLVWKSLLSFETVVSVKDPLFILRMTRQMNMNLLCGEKSQSKPTVFGEEPVALPLSPEKIRRGLYWERTRSSAVRSRQISTMNVNVCISVLKKCEPCKR
jgi:hypothetical protein